MDTLNRQSRRGLTCVAALLMLVMAGCASHGSALINSSPQGAEVVNMDDDTIVGITPVKMWWKSADDSEKFVNVRLQKAGYQDKTASFWVNVRHGSREDALQNPQQVSIELEKE